jgi:hypothetical protein
MGRIALHACQKRCVLRRLSSFQRFATCLEDLSGIAPLSPQFSQCFLRTFVIEPPDSACNNQATGNPSGGNGALRLTARARLRVLILRVIAPSRIAI